ncbi:MAG: thioesterase [Oscillospiraceae bacterium]|nr:thioesterase [Oscillospiraceae bacterium]
MQLSDEKCVLVTPGYSDAAGNLSVLGIFVLFQDLASEHAEKIGTGGAAMAERGLFWLTVRTRIRFYERPAMMEEVLLETWLARFQTSDVRTNRYYRMTGGGRLLAEGKTEWAVLRLGDQSVGRIGEAGVPEELAFRDEIVCPEPFTRFRTAFTEEDRQEDHRVRASDIDMGHHMNNTAYVRALLDTFPARELATMPVRELEICFRAPCYDGETLPVYRRRQETGWEFAIHRPDGKPAALARLL